MKHKEQLNKSTLDRVFTGFKKKIIKEEGSKEKIDKELM